MVINLLDDFGNVSFKIPSLKVNSSKSVFSRTGLQYSKDRLSGDF
jgi:hypothetical protein